MFTATFSVRYHHPSASTLALSLIRAIAFALLCSVATADQPKATFIDVTEAVGLKGNNGGTAAWAISITTAGWTC